MRSAFLAALLALCGCNFDAALDHYCEGSDRCSRDESGGLCALPQQTCDAELPCCEGAACVGGFCRASMGNVLTVASRLLDFGQVAPGQTAVQQVVVRNTGVGTASGVTLAPSTTVEAISVEDGGCAAALLPPGGECTFQVRFAPARPGAYAAALELGSNEAGARKLLLSATGTSGARVRVVRAGANGTVVSEPPGISCPTRCEAYFPLDSRVVLHEQTTPGVQLLRWSGTCEHAEPTCELTARLGLPDTRAEFVGALELEPSGSGSVAVVGASGSPNTTCNAPCHVVATGSVTLTATPGAWDVVFAGWGGACAAAGASRSCTVSLDAPARVTARFAQANVAFRTSVGYLPWTFGADGVGADQICTQEASLQHLPPNTYRAWLSSSTRSAREALGAAQGWVDASGKPVADSVEALVGGELLRPVGGLMAGEVASAPASGVVEAEAAATCGDWAREDLTFRAGNAAATSTSWSRDESWSARGCDARVALLCFGTDHTTPLPSRPTPPRPAFLSAPWLPAGGVSEADALCAREAAGAGFQGDYAAALAPAGQSVAQRFRAWVDTGELLRPDGASVASSRTALLEGAGPAAPLNVTADGHYVGPTSDGGSRDLVWTGGATSRAGTDEDTCHGWAGGGAGRVQRPEAPLTDVSLLRGADLHGRVPCDVPRRLYCLPR